MNHELTANKVSSTHNQTGFTLIELIVAIAIVAIVSAVGFVSYSQSQKIARDSRRKSDLQEISKALQLYYNDFGSYHPKLSALPLPTGCSVIGGDLYCYSNNATSPWIPPLSSNYVSPLPKDPKANSGDPNSGTTYGYAFMGAVAMCSGGVDGQKYMLFTRLENTADPDRLDANDRKLCPLNGQTLRQYNFSPYLYVLTN